MKKLTAKIFLFVLISIILNFGIFASAAGEPPSEPFKNMKECIDIKGGTDEGFIITIIEEPILTSDNVAGGDTTDFKSRLCYRQSFSYLTEDTGTKTWSILSKDKCKPELQGPYDEQYKAFYGCNQVQVLLSKGGTSLISGYLNVIYRWAAGIVGLICVIVIIVSGIQISLSGGDSQAVENAKNRIFKSISGIIVLFLSGLILYTVNPTFFTK